MSSSKEELLNISELKKRFSENGFLLGFGTIFCFGTSLVSQIIQAKTKLYDNEVVPSHVAIIWGDTIYESTTEVVKVNYKTIPSGVRAWKVKDFIQSEQKKKTKYYYYPYNKIDIDLARELVHLPYGVYNIVDFLLKNKSNGDKTHGLICSQFANKVMKISELACPSPADLFRIVKDLK